MSQDSNRKVVLSFGVKVQDAQELYRAAASRGVPVSKLIHSLLTDRTNGWRQFDTGDPASEWFERSRPGRKSTRFKNEE